MLRQKRRHRSLLRRPQLRAETDLFQRLFQVSLSTA
jgi:hypothetical protein